MKAEQQYYEEQAKFNKWLYELSDTERDHIEFMLKDYAQSELEKARELLDRSYDAVKHTTKDRSLLDDLDEFLKRKN